jgi:hypothetical protein
MGADAKVFVFDFKAYQEGILPAFHQLMVSRQTPEWLRPLISRLDLPATSWQPVDLLRHCTYLGADLSWSGPCDDTDLFAAGWDQRSCKSKECPENDHCPFHLNSSSGLAESLNELFKTAVSVKCLGQGQFIGRSWYITHYLTFLFGLGVRPNDPSVARLARLGKRGLVVGYQWTSSNVGISGWLEPGETGELADRLGELPLPRYEASFEATERFRRPEPLLYDRFGVMSYECPTSSFEALSLSFVRTVAAIAVRENQGILWGNDVLPAKSYVERYLNPTA